MEKLDYSHLSAEERAHEEFANAVAQESVDNLNRNVGMDGVKNIPVKTLAEIMAKAKK